MADAQDKSAPDWERIEADYRAGILSLREIASPFKVTEGAIRKRAKRDGWERDLEAKIQAKADALVRKAEVRTAVRTDRALTDRQIIEANAERIAQVRGEHRSDINRTRTLALNLMRELELETGDPELFERLGELLESPDEKGQDKLNEAYRKAISLPSRIGSMKSLAETMRIAVAMEREAYGLDAKESDGAGAVRGGVTYTANLPPRG